MKDILESTLLQLEKKKAESINSAKAKVLQETVYPHNVELEKEMNAKIAELTNSHNNAIAQLKNTYEKNRNEIVAEYSAKKKAFQDNLTESASSLINVSYEKAFSVLKNLIASCTE